MSNIDVLMEITDKDPALHSDADVDYIINWHRERRGGRVVKAKEAPGKKVDLGALGLAAPSAAPKGFVRRI